MVKKYLERFAQLEIKATELKNTKFIKHYSSNSYEFVNLSLLIQWGTSVLSLLKVSCGKESEHYKLFSTYEQDLHEGTFQVFERLLAVFNAAYEDYKGGFLVEIKALIHAEIFENELDQARELLEKNYLAAAAVIAGTVLETALRELCDRNNIPYGKINKMNADLVKVNAYNLFKSKKITALADIRNNAAHGNHNEYNGNDVQNLIKDIEDFLADQL